MAEIELLGLSVILNDAGKRPDRRIVKLLRPVRVQRIQPFAYFWPEILGYFGADDIKKLPPPFRIGDVFERLFTTSCVLALFTSFPQYPQPHYGDSCHAKLAGHVRIQAPPLTPRRIECGSACGERILHARGLRFPAHL
jgi:hypothetical protein